jgi:conjugal transfer ATP-binding protein TraC
MANQRLTLTKNNAKHSSEVEEVEIEVTQVPDSFLPHTLHKFQESFQHNTVHLSQATSDRLYNHLPYRRISNDSDNIFENKSTCGFILKISPFSGLSSTDINSLSKLIGYEIPADAFVQVINYASPNIGHILSKWESVISKDAGPIYKTLSKKRTEFYNAKQDSVSSRSHSITTEKRNFELYFCVSFKNTSNTEVQEKQNKSNNTGHDLSRETGSLHSRAKGIGSRAEILRRRIFDTRSKVIHAFRNLGCEVTEVNKEGLESYIAEILNLELIDDNNNLLNTKDNTSYTMYPDYVESQNVQSELMCRKKHLIFEVDEWPREWSLTDGINYVGDFNTGQGMPFPFYITFGYKTEDHITSERTATKMRVIRTNQTTSKLISFFPAMREEMDDWHYITEEIDKGARLAKSLMYIVIILNENTDLKSATQSIVDHFYQLGFKLNQIRYDCLNSIVYTLPLSLADNWEVLLRKKALTTIISSSCLNLLPIFSDPQNDKMPLMLFLGRRGQVFFFDNYASSQNGNYNMVVVGKSGSGKSVFLQEYMTSILRQGGQVVVIDDGRSFQNSTAILGGEFIDFGGQEFCINPFSLYQSSAEEYRENNDNNFKTDFEEPLIDLIVSIVCIVTNIDKNNTKHFETGLYRDVLKKAVQIVIETKKHDGGFKDIYNVLENDQFLRTEQTRIISDNLSYVLAEYAIGRYASYYNGKSTLSIDNLLTVFELSSLESNEVLQTSILLTTTFLVYAKMRARIRRTSLIIDEAWRLLRHDAIKNFIEGIARRARKYNGSLIVATQSISDFEEQKSQSAAAVLSQSDWRIILSAESKDSKILEDQLGLTKGEINIACHLKGDRGKYSEFMVRHSSGSWLIARLALDEFTAKLYSSKAEDVIKIKALMANNHTLEQAIELIIKE